jgi:hypothetical protein
MIGQVVTYVRRFKHLDAGIEVDGAASGRERRAAAKDEHEVVSAWFSSRGRLHAKRSSAVGAVTRRAAPKRSCAAGRWGTPELQLDLKE